MGVWCEGEGVDKVVGVGVGQVRDSGAVVVVVAAAVVVVAAVVGDPDARNRCSIGTWLAAVVVGERGGGYRVMA